MNLRHFVDEKHQFRLVLCGHKAVEAGAVCLVLMVGGHLGAITLGPGEYTEAALTGIGAFLFSLAISYTPIGKKLDHLAETFLS
jgi:hypothetical protein